MKKGVVLGIGAGLVLAGSVMSHAANCNYTMDYFKKNLPFPTDKATIVKQTPIDNDICNIILKVKTPYGDTRYVSTFAVKGNQSVIIGAMFKNNKSLTQKTIMELMAKDYVGKFSKYYPSHKNDFKKATMASYKPKKWNGQTAFVFTDPLCPFCQQLNTGLKEIADATGYRIALIPLPVHGPQSADKIKSFICNNKKFDDYVNGKYGEVKDCKNATSIMNTAWNIEKDLKVMGTPTIITTDGKAVFTPDKEVVKEVLNGKSITK